MSPKDSQNTLWNIKEKKRKKRKRRKKSKKKGENEAEEGDDATVVHPLRNLAFDWKISGEPDAYNDEYDRYEENFESCY